MNSKHPPGPAMTLGNMRPIVERGGHNVLRRQLDEAGRNPQRVINFVSRCVGDCPSDLRCCEHQWQRSGRLKQ